MRMHTRAQVLDLARADAEQLLSRVSPAAQLADRIGSRVRKLDRQAAHVGATLQLIHLVLDRTHCVSGVQAAMAAGDYDAAAQHVSSFLSLEARLSPALRGGDAGQAAEQRQVRRGWVGGRGAGKR